MNKFVPTPHVGRCSCCMGLGTLEAMENYMMDELGN